MLDPASNMQAAPRARPFDVFGHRDFRIFEAARFAGTLGLQMQSVAVGWQVYDLTGKAFDLGMVGLVQFAPMLALSLVTGHVADRFDRRLILIAYHAVLVVCAVALALLARAPVGSGVWPIYAVLVVLGVARAFAGPASQALMPSLVPTEHFSGAVAWNSSIWQVGTVLGPTLGGFLYHLEHGAELVYYVFGGLALLAFGLILAMRVRPGPLHSRGSTWERLLAGVRYVGAHEVLLGAISLDLFAVLLGGAVALMPIYARDILLVGPIGLGMLRSAPAFGAAATAILLAFRPLKRRAGAVMLWCVAGFGVATCVFGLSRSFGLSLAALVVIGATDMISVFVRQTLVQLRTPHEMRGRVSAVSQVFIGASNELGEFESGATAAWFGAVPATIIGGIGTLVVVGIWAWRFPQLRRADRLLPEPP